MSPTWSTGTIRQSETERLWHSRTWEPAGFTPVLLKPSDLLGAHVRGCPRPCETLVSWLGRFFYAGTHAR